LQKLDSEHSQAAQGPRGWHARAAAPPATGNVAAARPENTADPAACAVRAQTTAKSTAWDAERSRACAPSVPVSTRRWVWEEMGVELSPEARAIGLHKPFLQTARYIPCNESAPWAGKGDLGSRSCSRLRAGRGTPATVRTLGASPCTCARPRSPPRSLLRP
jgi:hypothetical protein